MARKIITVFNRYYNQDIKKLTQSLVKNSPNICFIESLEDIKRSSNKKFEYYMVVNAIGDVPDVQLFLQELRKVCRKDNRVVITYYNYLWEPVLKLAEFLKLKKKQHELNWLTLEDIENLLKLTDFSIIKKGEMLLIPVYIPLLSPFVNKYIAKLPLINKLCLTNYIVTRPVGFDIKKEFNVSVVIPARNEEGNIPNIIKRLPKLGKSQEVVFVEGHSKDNTWEAILKLKKRHPKENIKVYKQTGVGKADAVRLAVSKAKGDIIIILDSDLSVAPEELVKFYSVLKMGRGEFINGSRLVYPLEKESMRFLNILGNKFFSIMFSWILKQYFTDTLCGTKAFWRKDYKKILELRKIYGDFDPFGDFELIFGATHLNLQVVEVPIRYRPRTYGQSNISRFTHGLLLLKMCLYAIWRIKFS